MVKKKVQKGGLYFWTAFNNQGQQIFAVRGIEKKKTIKKKKNPERLLQKETF